MRISKQKLWRGSLAFLVITSAAFFTSPAAAEMKSFDIQIEERQVVGENKVVRVTQGDEVLMTWRTDESVAVHLHGYDIEQHVEVGVTAEMSFVAHATGRFPVTSHGFEGQHESHGHQALLYFEVHPE